MIIGINGNEANTKIKVGINAYAFELLWGLYKTREEWSHKHKLIVYLQNKPLDDLPPGTKSLEYKVISGSGVWILTKLTPYLFRNPEHIDIFFTPGHYVPPLARIPNVMSIMDLGYLNFSAQFKRKDYWQLKLWTAYSLMVSKYIIAISNSTKKDIVRHYSFAKNKTFVTYLGYDKVLLSSKNSTDDVRRIKEKYSIVNDYVVFVSTLKPSKNIEGLLKAWRQVIENYSLQLVIVGKKGWLYESIFKLVQQLGMEGKVIFTDYVTDEEKIILIKQAKLLVLPSFWEGFGLDPLYAMAAGIPTVVSNQGSLPEVVGDAGTLVDPYDTNSIAKGILKVLSLPQEGYNKLAKMGKAQAAKYDWNKTALETINIIEGKTKQ